MPQPTELPRWADQAATGDVVEPNETKKGAGWVVEQPPHNYFNWWMNLVYRWCGYVAGLTAEVLTWTARQTFSGGATVVDPPVNGTDAASKNYVDVNGGSQLLGSANTWTEDQTFTGGATVIDPPVHGTDPASKNYVDGLPARNNAFSGQNTFSATNVFTADQKFTGVSSGVAWQLDVDQNGNLVKRGGALLLGTWDASLVSLWQNGLERWVWNADGSLSAIGANAIHNLTDPTSAQDAATKNYVDASGRIRAWGLLTVGAQNPTNNPGMYYVSVQGFGIASAWGSGDNLTICVKLSTTPPANFIVLATVASGTGATFAVNQGRLGEDPNDLHLGTDQFYSTGLAFNVAIIY